MINLPEQHISETHINFTVPSKCSIMQIIYHGSMSVLIRYVTHVHDLILPIKGSHR